MNLFLSNVYLLPLSLNVYHIFTCVCVCCRSREHLNVVIVSASSETKHKRKRVIPTQQNFYITIREIANRVV